MHGENKTSHWKIKIDRESLLEGRERDIKERSGSESYEIESEAKQAFNGLK